MAILVDITELEATFATTGNDITPAVNPPTGGWVIDFENQYKVTHFTEDGLEILKQSIRMMLDTERIAWLIYSSDYGQEFKSYLTEQDDEFALAMLPTLIQNTLLVDDRIITCVVENVKIRAYGVLSFDIRLNTIFGEVLVEAQEAEV